MPSYTEFKYTSPDKAQTVSVKWDGYLYQVHLKRGEYESSLTMNENEGTMFVRTLTTQGWTEHDDRNVHASSKRPARNRRHRDGIDVC
jgi:hypothetical protein